MPTKVCSFCGENRSLDDFCIKKHLKDGLNTKCKDCVRKTAELIHWGKTYEDLQLIYGTVCNICNQDEKVETKNGKPHRLCIDHDHTCCEIGCENCIRGLLCRSCNYQLGVLETKSWWMQNALDYLDKTDFGVI